MTIHKNSHSCLFLLLLMVFGLITCAPEDELILLNPNAGQSFLDIENDGYKIQLNAVTPPKGQTGTWRIYIGENGVLDDIHDARTIFHGEPGEVYQLGWEVSSGNEYKAAVITVSFKALNPVIISEIPAQLINNVSQFLEAEPARFGASGKWEITQGSNGRLINQTSHLSAFVGKEKSAYSIRWVLTYGSKEVNKEISFTTDVLRANAGEDRLDIKTSKTAINKFFTTEAFLPAGGTGEWSWVSGNGIIHSVNNPASLLQGVADSLYTLTWKVRVDEYESTDTVNFRFRGKWGMWTDPRDQQNYRFTELNGLEWMSENYNYAARPGSGSVYYGQAERSIVQNGHPLETETDRKVYGRLYFLNTAIDFAPQGWRLPTAQEVVNLINSLGGPLYAKASLQTGGSTGLELNLPGYFELSSPSDPAFRNVFRDQETLGMFWTSDYNPGSNSAIVLSLQKQDEQIATSILLYSFYALPVRYVRSLQK